MGAKGAQTLPTLTNLAVVADEEEVGVEVITQVGTATTIEGGKGNVLQDTPPPLQSREGHARRSASSKGATSTKGGRSSRDAAINDHLILSDRLQICGNRATRSC